MRQAPGMILVVPVLTAIPPAGNVGVDMTQFFAAAKVWKYALWAQLTGGVSCELWLWVRRASDDIWHLVADVGNLGKLGGGALATGFNYVFKLEDIGIFDEIVVTRQNDGGGGGVTVACQLQEYIENNFMRGD